MDPIQATAISDHLAKKAKVPDQEFYRAHSFERFHWIRRFIIGLLQRPRSVPATGRRNKIVARHQHG